jgi:hypothetical protein
MDERKTARRMKPEKAAAAKASDGEKAGWAHKRETCPNETKEAARVETKASETKEEVRATTKADGTTAGAAAAGLVRLVATGALKGANPAGNLNLSLSGAYLYVGSGTGVNVFEATTGNKVAAILTPSSAPRALAIGGARLLVISGTQLLLYDNLDPLRPVLVSTLELGTAALDLVVGEACSRTRATAYVVGATALCTVSVNADQSLTLANTFALHASLDASVWVDLRGHALYVAPVVHGFLYFFALRRAPASSPQKEPKASSAATATTTVAAATTKKKTEDSRHLLPVLRARLYNRYLAGSLTQSSVNVNVLIVGLLFGVAFYDVRSVRRPRLMSSQRSNYLNLIQVVPDTDLVVNAVFGPVNRLCVARLRGLCDAAAGNTSDSCSSAASPASSDASRSDGVGDKEPRAIVYEPVQAVRLHPGRLPWDVLVHASASTHCNTAEFSVWATNSSEAPVETFRLSLPCPAR